MSWWLVVGALGVVLLAVGIGGRRWALATLRLLRRRAGYVRHSIGVDGFELIYQESGRRDAPPLLLLHGFGGDSDNWVRLAPLLRRDFRILVPDLPGFGETGYLPGKSYSLEAQVARLKDFVEMLHLDRFHVVGNSMGGYLAAAFAATYPERIATLGLFNAAGVDMTTRSPFYDAALAGRNLLLVRSPADFRGVLELVYHKQPWMPGYLRRFMAAHRILVSDDQDAIFQEIFGERVWLDEHMAQIKAPTLILWGDDDRVLDISSVQLFKAGIPHAQVAILPACGHVPMLEKPAETARVYRAFLAGVADGSVPAAAAAGPTSKAPATSSHDVPA